MKHNSLQRIRGCAMTDDNASNLSIADVKVKSTYLILVWFFLKTVYPVDLIMCVELSLRKI